MTRSYRKINSHHRNIGSSSIRWYKQLNSRKARKRAKNALACHDWDRAEEVTRWNEWSSPRDGKFYIPRVRDPELIAILRRK